MGDLLVNEGETSLMCLEWSRKLTDYTKFIVCLN